MVEQCSSSSEAPSKVEQSGTSKVELISKGLLPESLICWAAERLMAKEVMGWDLFFDLCSWNDWEDSADLLVMMVIGYSCL